MTGERRLLTDEPKERMNFDAFVVSDWIAHEQIDGCTGSVGTPFRLTATEPAILSSARVALDGTHEVRTCLPAVSRDTLRGDDA